MDGDGTKHCSRDEGTTVAHPKNAKNPLKNIVPISIENLDNEKRRLLFLLIVLFVVFVLFFFPCPNCDRADLLPFIALPHLALA